MVIRSLITMLCALVLRIFFRRIDVVAPGHVPATGPVVFVLNHPNGLLDPLFILVFGGRRVSFLAKAPLFDMPVIGALVRVMDCLPVYRRSDNLDPAHNRRTLEAARAILGSGGAIAIFPEGTSHSDPSLRPLRSGAARIALGANAAGNGTDSVRIAPESKSAGNGTDSVRIAPESKSAGNTKGPMRITPVTPAAGSGNGPVRIVPAGLIYDAKERFRSDAALVFGSPITLPEVTLDEHLEPPAGEAVALTERIEAELGALVLQARSDRALRLAASAQRIFDSAGRDDAEARAPRSAPASAFELRKQIVAGYEALEISHSRELEHLTRRIEQHENLLGVIGAGDSLPPRRALEPMAVARYALRAAVRLIVLGIPGFIGMVLHWPAYRLTGWIARHFSKGEADVTATAKAFAALVFFPLTWLALGLAAHAWLDLPGWHVLLLVAAGPLLGYAALRLLELLGSIVSSLRVVWLVARRRRIYTFLIEERRQIRDEILDLAERLAPRP